MAIFIYKAKNARGESQNGEIESSDERIAASILRKKSLIVISVKLKNVSTNNFLDRFFNKVGFNELVIVTRQLAIMVGAGLVLSESIDILEEQQENKKFKQILGEVSHDIKGGLTLANALGKHQDVFPPLYINLVRSGETSGKLDEVLVKMADSMEKEREFKAKVTGAMIYPAVVITIMFLVVILMMVFVIPKLTAFYKESSLDLPLPTKILISASNFFINFWWLILTFIIISVVFINRWIKTKDGKYMVDKIILRVPIIGRLTTNVTLTNFTRTFALLIAAGIPLLQVINIVENVTENAVFKASLKEAYNGVERGLPFSSLLNASIFPRIVSQMVKVGEETGKVDEIFLKLSEYFESESDHLVKNLTVAIEPIILIVLGVGVAFLALSIMLPIYKLTTSF